MQLYVLYLPETIFDLLEGYIYYNLQSCLMLSVIIVKLYLNTFKVMICSNVLYSYRFYIYQKVLFIIVKYTSGYIYKKAS